MTVLDVRDLRRSFGGIAAVAGVSFAVERAEIVGIIGPNGSGKSTLFNLLTKVLRPDAGRIRLFGKDVTRWSQHRIARLGLGRTFQIPALFTNMSARDNLRTAAVESDWKRAPDRADEVLELLNLQEVAHNLAGNLSGGQQRLVELGRVLMRDPKLVLLDEVAAGVHPRLRETMLTVIRRMRDQGTAFLVIEHDMELAQEICDRVIVMDAGEVVAEGPMERIAQDPYVVEVYLGVPVE